MRDPTDFLADELRTRPGEIPDSLENARRETPTFAISENAFSLKLPSGLQYLYQRGKGVTVFQPENVTDAEVALFLYGSVYGAVAWLNGFVPLHASAVVCDGQVHAFTGTSGAGKSTLAFALGSAGFPLFADDVLVLDLSDPDPIMCLPGHKKTKLWDDALELTGATPKEQVRPEMDKYYVEPPGNIGTKPLPLKHLSFLRDHANQAVCEPILGTDKIIRAKAAFYRPLFINAIAGNREIFAILSRISREVSMSVIDRPRGRDMFDSVTEFVAGAIRGEHG